MTVCIAASCGDRKKPRILLCVDTSLDHGEWGSNETATKAVPIGFNWCALMAGEWAVAREMMGILRGNIKAGECPTTRHQIVSLVRDSASQFVFSSLYPRNGNCDLLVTGFIANEPVIIYLNISKGKPYVTMTENFCAIGQGGTIASTILNQRGYGRVKRVEDAVYMVYEAKRWSEKVTSVGPGTFVIIQSPDENPQKDRLAFKLLSKPALAALDAVYKKFGLQPMEGIEPFPEGFYI